MEEIVNLAKKHSLEPEFYEQAAASLKYLSKALKLTGDESMLLSFFFEHSSKSRIWISSIAEMINVSNIRIIAMMNVADSLIKKGFLIGRSNGKDERYYTIPGNVVNAIRLGLPVTPVKTTDLTTDEFFDRLGEVFEDDDIPFHERVDMLEALV